MAGLKTAHFSPVILNVDHNGEARATKTQTLQSAGFAVFESGTGREAMALLQQQKIDLILLDMQLPDMSGFDVCRSIKQNPATSSVLVLQTAETLMDSGDRVRGLEIGADNFLVGPIGPLELIANVRALLRLREAQHALHENEERFQQMAENIGDVFWIFDPKKPQLFYISPAYEKLWEKSSARLYDDLNAWLDNVHPHDRRRVERAYRRLLNYRDYEEEFRLCLPGGRERWIHDRGFKIPDGNGNNYRIARISQDITASKAAALALHEATLRKDEFLATLAHELRNPLAPMRTAVDLMRLAEAGDIASSEVVVEAREIISRHINHLVRLVDDLLDVSRITQGKLSLQKRVVELQPIIDIAVESTEPYIRDRNHQLIVKLPDKPLWINGDSVRLAQVIGNLLHNAAKYTAPGGKIEVTVDCEEHGLTIEVSDNGIGIAPDSIDSIFNLFTQAQRLHSRAPEGLGVGLSLVKRLVELHDGTVKATSAGPGTGSKFTIELPIECGPLEDQSSQHSAEKTERVEQLRILLVDDAVDAANMMCMVLKNFGHDVHVAHDGASALLIAPEIDPHVILMDIGLPGMDGYGVAREMMKIPALKNTTLVALTGYGQEKDREKAFASGFSHHFIKPVEIHDLNNFLKRVEVF